MSDELKKVRVLQDNGGGLIQIEDAFGDCWVKRGRVHKVGNDYVLSSERQAQIARASLARREQREAKKLAQQKLDREEKAAKSPADEVAA
jgi:hypothetical protein